MEKMRMETLDLVSENVKKIEQLFPNCITETGSNDNPPRKSIDFDKLRQILSGDIIEGNESYEFTWVGKKASIIEANRPIRKTLRPVKEDSVNWDTTENLYIEGDNLEALKLLQESYLGKVKMIYIDPPYNTGHDFIYPDSFRMDEKEYDEGTGYFDEDGNINYAKENSIGAARYHSDWCSMMYSRLLLSRNILSKDGVVAISISCNELYNLMKICEELFYSHQIFAITVQTSGGKPNGAFNISNEYLVIIAPQNFSAIPSEEDMKESSAAYHGMTLATFNQTQRPNQAYPIYVNDKGVIIGCGKTLNERIQDGEYKGEPGDYVFDYAEAPKRAYAIWPVSAKGEQCVWRLIPERLLSDWKKGYIKIIPQDNPATKNKFSIQYLSGGIIEKIENGEMNTVRVSENPDIPTLEITNYRTAGSSIQSIWVDSNYYTTKGKDEMRQLFESKVFSYPKPVSLIRYILKRTTINNDIILDFFSGSSTTAHAVMKLNSEDGGHRKFIMVQLPEPCNEKSEAYTAGYTNICEIGKERIRRAGRKIQEEAGLLAQDLDVGFRVFKVDSSNMKDVYYAPNEINQNNLFDMESNIKEDRTDLDLLFGCLLEWGLPLSMPYKSEDIGGYAVHTYNDGDLIACFDDNVPDNVIKEIAGRKPLRVVFRDSSFTDSPSKINVGEIFKLISPDTRIKVI